MKICYEPIGILHCEVQTRDRIPKFYTNSDIKGWIEIYDPFVEGLMGIEKYDKILVLFHFHLSGRYTLIQSRREHGEVRGVFSLRSPLRPNPIGLSILKLNKIKGNLLYVDNVDMLDSTPILDIKPYIKDDWSEVKTGK